MKIGIPFLELCRKYRAKYYGDCAALTPEEKREIEKKFSTEGTSSSAAGGAQANGGMVVMGRESFGIADALARKSLDIVEENPNFKDDDVDYFAGFEDIDDEDLEEIEKKALNDVNMNSNTTMNNNNNSRGEDEYSGFNNSEDGRMNDDDNSNNSSGQAQQNKAVLRFKDSSRSKYFS